jgi:uncharacterized protein (TIGR00369 family)
MLCIPGQNEEKGIMNIMTHRKISAELCGRPLAVGEGHSQVELKTIPDMTVDDFGLVHGGFIFGLADHAAMIAVNHPNVVLGAADVKFLKPVKVNDTVIAEAKVAEKAGKKHVVPVSVKRDNEVVFEGTFICFILEKHVFE